MKLDKVFAAFNAGPLQTFIDIVQTMSDDEKCVLAQMIIEESLLESKDN